MSRAPRYVQLPRRARVHLDAGHSELIYNPYKTATWRTTRPSGYVQYLKAAFDGGYPTLATERERCAWLHERGAPVPEPIDYGSDGHIEWLVTAGLPGVDATSPAYLADPARTVPILAEGLRAFHAIDPTGCPFDYRLPTAIAHVAARVAAGTVDPADFHDVHRQLDPAQALEQLYELAVDEDDLVVCHGDYCLPNVLLHDGRVAGYLDLAEVGVSGQWRDLAVATWSVTWNLGPGYEDLFLAAYGTDWDITRRDLYRLLYDLES